MGDYRNNTKCQPNPSPLLEECHFSLEDDNEAVHVHFGAQKRESQKKLLNESTSKASTETRTRWSGQTNQRRGGESSPLTDEIDLGRDSDSDDLDLLPVVNQASQKNKSANQRRVNVFKCCNPYWVRPKCTIM